MQTWADFPLALLLLLGPAVLADESADDTAEDDTEAVMDMEFLEYLGSWDESDEDWLLFDAPEEARDEVAGNPAGKDADDGDEKDDEA